MQLKTLTKITSCLLISGETGTGKTTLAKKIHDNSDRKQKPFIRINLANLNSQLIESELFGHTKGSFTGAVQDKTGLLDLVEGGTLFLDEVAELDKASQKKLLDVIELKSYKKVGGTKEKKFSGVIFVATNKDLKEEVKNNRFREDLYYRIRIFEYKLPSLKDCYNLPMNILEQLTSKNTRYISIEPCAFEALLGYTWPGNFRELVNSIEYILTVLEGDRVGLAHLPPWIIENDEVSLKDNYKNAFEKFEKCFITDKLRQHLGKINETAKALEISKTTLIQKIRKYKIDNKKQTEFSKKYLGIV